MSNVINAPRVCSIYSTFYSPQPPSSARALATHWVRGGFCIYQLLIQFLRSLFFLQSGMLAMQDGQGNTPVPRLL
jgi:hypothetical protein